jgi:hypothetical protein
LVTVQDQPELAWQEAVEAQSKATTWYGQPAVIASIPLGTISDRLPIFRRESFGQIPDANEYLDKIVREPIGSDHRRIPVAVVSRRYALVQHREVLAWLQAGLQAAGYDPASLLAERTLSVYGERMRLVLRVPEIDFDPGDGFVVALMVECQNSVDRSCALEVRVTWRRLICTNGMWAKADESLRKIHHLDWMSDQDVGQFLRERIKNAPKDIQLFHLWRTTDVSIPEIEHWADTEVKSAWGPHLAARLCHIARSGFDGAVGGRDPKAPPSRRAVSSDREVPGACAPVQNVYHAFQVLSWLAGQRPAVEDQQEMLRSIPRLVQRLIQ